MESLYPLVKLHLLFSCHNTSSTWVAVPEGWVEQENRRKKETWLMRRGNVFFYSYFRSSSWFIVSTPPGGTLWPAEGAHLVFLCKRAKLAPSPHSQWVYPFLKQSCLSSGHCQWGVTTDIPSWDITSSSNLRFFLWKYTFLAYQLSEIIKFTSTVDSSFTVHFQWASCRLFKGPRLTAKERNCSPSLRT